MAFPDPHKSDVEHIETVATTPFPDNMKSESNYDFSPGEEKKLVRKIDMFLLPTIWLMYLLSYMDRTNIGNAKIAGMMDDLRLTSNQYSVSLIVFFVSYVVFEVPSNLILSRTRPSIFLPTIMFLWGGITCCMAAVHNFGQLVALRFVVGIFEAGFAPGILLILSSWYKKNEQSKRFGVYISAAVLSGAFGGILAGAITGGLDGAHGIAGWRWLFIVEGVATCGWSVISAFLLLDFPATSRKLSARERALAVRRLTSDNAAAETEDEVHLGPLRAFLESVRNWRTWLMVVGYMVRSLSSPPLPPPPQNLATIQTNG
ncbi:putative transporter [Diplodia seriata]|uniref:Putative transporter n=1 Tax=Diplodia seriata TaxID=420778 RepID=A0A1S8B6T8_9PEZI|nr:putative transporter [Diplodia seriata]